MKESSISNFGLLIAFIVPGFTALWGASAFSPTLLEWLGATAGDTPTVGGFLYVTIGSIAAGLTVSTVRWAVIDTLHYATGLRPARWDFSRLRDHATVYDMLIEIHYRYYQFYANMVIALAVLYVASRLQSGFFAGVPGLKDLGFIALEAIFLAGSRDTLRKYYERSAHLLSDSPTAYSQSSEMQKCVDADPASIKKDEPARATA